MHSPRDLFEPAVRDELYTRMEGRTTPLFLDYDGTLTPIVDNPADAQLDPAMRQALEALAARQTVALVSGRDLQALQRFVGLDSVYYAGSHGFEIVGPGGVHRCNEEAEAGLEALAAAAEALDTALAEVEGTLLERKRFALAVHYRNTPEDQVAAVRAAVDEVLERHPGLRCGPGKCVFELQPDVAWDKGRAVLWLLEALSLNNGDTLPIYIGDDWTDEHAFRALEGRGVGIFVGDLDRATAADYRVADVDAVRQFFEQMLKGLER
ncbi:trehalose-phosphatase [Halorhodospira halophila]|uniref:Trehalose 6-phosphate phosphatase n=1 Tax=Halorhodospira halophila (strain DSM 244 / SL1) TaxID=349124 RepID=A1WTX7_HALHL|nr:trehalose-phosphatase [Halorhodospira halophila]ABM61139.1 trehalose 6-phosphatase [Halorhodospira halophila SL1]MBK1729667.1 trehalose-phosphatase [Halorhodospira halophila]